MDLIPLSSRRLQRENTEEGQGQVTPPLPLPKPGPLPASPCSHPPSGVGGLAQAEKTDRFSSSIIPGCHG